MEERKRKEIEHSRKRREVLQGFERISDTHAIDKIDNLDELIKDKEKYNYYFANMKYYSVTKSSERYKEKWLKKKIKSNDKVIDFACGNGENGILAAQFGAAVKGIDISPEGVDNANLNAKEMNVDKRCKFLVMDGENLEFKDNTFDFGVEYGALHHVDLDKALSELSRVIKNDGEMICVEALRHNPLIHWYRKLTPHLRTEWEVEHILGVESLEIMSKYFKKVDVKFFHLFSLLLVPFRKMPFFNQIYKIFDWFDSIILSIPIIGKFAWIMIIELSEPIK
ncbi:class I SAM-dependent methyltransferase [Prochlorococcus marinus]|uniref:Methyltransferase type 11 n=1 Tax=Prochlorococcus marinus str. GP2 TaxID=59925 RepID=A0A0A1ZDY2_PROMR|nr:class I SAM-dependent methyltransferase [Prochlorococcus marinus]KGF86483.1 Methyltransferase type 11 [Prochlorococcus marinus str. GP2]